MNGKGILWEYMSSGFDTHSHPKMVLNWIPPHIQNDSSNHKAILQKDEVSFNSGKAEGDIAPQEDNPLPALLQFEISVLEWILELDSFGRGISI